MPDRYNAGIFFVIRQLLDINGMGCIVSEGEYTEINLEESFMFYICMQKVMYYKMVPWIHMVMIRTSLLVGFPDLRIL